MFVVLRTEAIPDHLRGYISRFLVEVTPGFFVGNSSPRLTEKLWSKVTDAVRVGTATLVYSSKDSEFGYETLTAGARSVDIVNLDGLNLICRRTMSNGSFGGSSDGGISEDETPVNY
ncbi:MAG: type I-E CRISPR-associated endoribonuclease Cas2e [Actinomycetaceae bacterium]|nr:type I-E CRISPR-associated endoribonuclease Cas2e [Actinomycetaceae bacterium]